MLQMPENPGFLFSMLRDLFQWRETASGLQVSLIWGKDLQSLQEKMGEETRLRCEAEEQLKAQEAHASHERSEHDAQIRALE
jgi:hypothetical protein